MMEEGLIDGAIGRLAVWIRDRSSLLPLLQCHVGT